MNNEFYDFDQNCSYDHFSLDWFRGSIAIDSVLPLLEAFDRAGFHFSNWCIKDRAIRFYNSVLTYCGNDDIQIAWNCESQFPFTLAFGEDVIHHYYYSSDNRPFVLGFDCHKGCRFFPSLETVQYLNDRNLNSGIYIEVRGDGLRYLRSLGLYSKFLDVIRQFPFRPTRLDFAFDIYDRENPFVPLVLGALDHRLKEEFTTGNTYINTRKQIHSFNAEGKCIPNLFMFNYAYKYNGERRDIINVNFGKHGSESGMFRLYDKFYERSLYMDRFRPEGCSIDYWYRFEYETCGKLASICWDAFVSDHYNAALAFNKAAEYLFDVIDVLHGESTITLQERSPLWQSFLDWCGIIQNQYTTYFEKSTTPDERSSKVRFFRNLASSSLGVFVLLSQLDEAERFRCIEEMCGSFICNSSNQSFLRVNFSPDFYDFFVRHFYDSIESFSKAIRQFSVLAIDSISSDSTEGGCQNENSSCWS